VGSGNSPAGGAGLRNGGIKHEEFTEDIL